MIDHERDAGERGCSLLHKLMATGPIRMPVAIVVAHPDDEMIGVGGSMTRLLDLTLIHITDGAPTNVADLQALGVASRDEYATMRRAELDAALAAACVRPVRRLCYAVPDQRAASDLNAIVQRLAADLMSVEVVITHPYEGGHVDHDACALGVHAAVATLQDLTGRSPAIVEFASYYRRHGEVRAGLFWPDPQRPEFELKLSPSAVRRREAAFACFTSQRNNLQYFSLQTERFRLAPAYDFGRPAPPENAEAEPRRKTEWQLNE